MQNNEMGSTGRNGYFHSCEATDDKGEQTNACLFLRTGDG